MSKFEDIKVGDTVYRLESIRFGAWFQKKYKTFFIPEKVTKVTKSQFIVDDIKVWKKNGDGVGKRYAYKLGEKIGNTIVTDQSAECVEFIDCIESIRECITMSKLLASLLEKSDLPMDKLSKLKAKLIEIKEILN